MPDMLVKLYELAPLEPQVAPLQSEGVVFRRALPPERHVIGKFAETHFNAGWRSECEVAISHQPATCFVAIENGNLLGFACYDATMKGFFGPTGVDMKQRGRGIGKALLFLCLHDMWAAGYGYCIIGAAGPIGFYERTVGARAIEGSEPGVYAGLLTE